MPNENQATDLFEIIRTTRSMRRLKPDPVPNGLIRKILKAGVCAPSGGNMQRWRFLVVKDPKIKETVGALYKRAWDEQVAPRCQRRRENAPAGRSKIASLMDGRGGRGCAESFKQRHPELSFPVRSNEPAFPSRPGITLATARSVGDGRSVATRSTASMASTGPSLQ